MDKPFKDTSIFFGIKEFIDNYGCGWRAIINKNLGIWQIFRKGKRDDAFIYHGCVPKNKYDTCQKIWEKYQDKIDIEVI